MLDAITRGGLLTRGITEIYGESSVGKTQLCLQLCLTAQLPVAKGGLGAGAVYLAAEDVFPNKRLHQMASHFQRQWPVMESQKLEDGVYIQHAGTVEDMWQVVSRKLPLLMEQKHVRLVVIDSLASLYRAEYQPHQMVDRAQSLTDFARNLKQLSDRFNAPIVCINQVTDVISRDAGTPRQALPALGQLWSDMVNCRFLLQRHTAGPEQQASRTLHTVLAPHLPPQTCEYTIDEAGLHGTRLS